MAADDPTTRFGEPEAVYRPSPGQPLAGTCVCGGAAAALFAAAAFGTGLDTPNRVSGGLLGVAAAGIGGWLYRLRWWRLVLFARGLVQVRPGGVDELHWADVREVVRVRLWAFADPTTRVELFGPAGRVVVNPVNTRSRVRLFDALVAAAERRGVPVRVEWEESNG